MRTRFLPLRSILPLEYIQPGATAWEQRHVKTRAFKQTMMKELFTGSPPERLANTELSKA